jgi:hypothetical protein
MPNIGVHLLVAGRALQHWRAHPGIAPFDARDAQLAGAFLHGSLLPDAGYFPRGDRLFSELAHVWRTGDLARAMLGSATSSVQRAHAIGWLGHVLADLAVHPLINVAHGEWLHGERERPISSSEDEAGHMRLEFGLDSAVFVRYPEIGAVRLPAAPPRSELEHVARAFRQVFDWAPTERRVGTAQRSCGWMVRLTLLAHPGASSARRPLQILLHDLARRVAPPVRWSPVWWNQSSAVQAVLSPREPPDWLLHEIATLLHRLPAWLDRLLADNLAGLGNHDLVTGAVHDLAPGPRALSALRALEARIAAPAFSRVPR